MRKSIYFMASLMMMAACGPKTAVAPAIDLTNLDTTVSPAADFYRYATGGWQAKNPLKPEFSRYGSFDVDRALTLLWYETRTRTILHPSGWLCHAIEHHYRTRNIPHTGRQQRRERFRS